VPKRVRRKGTLPQTRGLLCRTLEVLREDMRDAIAGERAASCVAEYAQNTYVAALK
jgi:hypothetical protein